jgi:hypothetical protein
MALSRTDLSGTITSGGTAQVLAEANSDREGWFLQNHSVESLWVSDVGTAAASQPSIEIKAGVAYETPYGGSSGAELSIFGATTGSAFTAREW